MCSEESFIATTEIAVTEEILLWFDLSLHGNLHILRIYNYMGSVRFPGPPDLGSLVKCY